VEFAQGCPENQRCIFDARVTDDINAFLRSPELRLIEAMVPDEQAEHDMKPDDVKAAQEKVAHLLLACGNLVLSMMENSDEETRETAKEIEDTLDIKRVFETLYRYGHFQVGASMGCLSLWTVSMLLDFTSPTCLMHRIKKSSG